MKETKKDDMDEGTSLFACFFGIEGDTHLREIFPLGTGMVADCLDPNQNVPKRR